MVGVFCVQMENIEVFVTFCEAYGVPRTSVFQTVDLFEGRNMAQVLSCIQQLGSEVSIRVVVIYHQLIDLLSNQSGRTLLQQHRLHLSLGV